MGPRIQPRPLHLPRIPHSPFCILNCAGLVFGFFFLADSSSFFIDQILIILGDEERWPCYKKGG